MSKKDKRTQPDWEVYERLIARMVADQLSTGYCVTPNARLRGIISERVRQIDVLIDSRHDTDNTRRIIVDAKKRTRKVDVLDVESFRGLMEDVEASHGYLVSSTGYTKAAEKRAQESVSLRIVPLDRLNDFDPSEWPECRNEKCKRGRIFWNGYPELSLTAQPLIGVEQEVLTYVHYVGKCDRCGRFYVKCLTCGDFLSPLEDEDDCGHQCRCKLPWFWLASIEQDKHGRRSAELHAVLGFDQVITVDRRGL